METRLDFISRAAKNPPARVSPTLAARQPQLLPAQRLQNTLGNRGIGGLIQRASSGST